MADKGKLDPSMFLDDYLNDAREGFQVASEALLSLERDPFQAERLNEVFRVVHTLKSSSAMLEYSGIAELAHFTEDVLERLRRKELPLNQDNIGLLFETIDLLETMVNQRSRDRDEGDQGPVAAAHIDKLKQRITKLESQHLLVGQGVITINEDGVVESFNPAAERIFGYGAAEIIGQKIDRLMPEPYKSEHDGYLHNYRHTGNAKMIGIGREVVGLRKDASTFPMELAVNEMRLGGRRLFIGIVREIADREAKSPEVLAIEKTRTIRVHVDLLDSQFNLVGELIIAKNRIDTILSDGAPKELKAAMATIDRIVSELQENVSAARLVPVDEVFQRFPRLVRDLALAQHKEIDLVLEGRQIELDKAVLDAISDPLVHLLRNAVDHGIEPAGDRQRRHKSRCGTIKLSARRTENQILIEVADDGGGIDIARVKEVALGKAFLSPEEAGGLSERAALNLIFMPGFTSAKEVTGLSGRGVGLDVVKTATERLGGTVVVVSQPGEGTRFTLQLPLATAIIQTLMVGVGDHVFAVPSDSVLEALDLKPGGTKKVGKDEVLVRGNDFIPFFRLKDLLQLPDTDDSKNRIAVILHRGEGLIGIGVDTVLDQMENIIKPLDPLAQKIKGFSGGTILGDGRVALLLDIPRLLSKEPS
jgi:two-component system, chemotaxis family, sensor kinase CheA